MSLHDFRIISKIGEGAFSIVHKVKRISDDKIYALKQIKMNNLKQKEKENSLNQVRLLASISCDYIIKYKQSFYDQMSNTLCIVIQYAQNGDLQKLILQKKSKLQWISEEQIWKMFRNIATGLNALHQKNIIHRDLKSANIFMSNGIYKIADLNVSKLMKNSLAYTQTGTPYYASPQVWQDKPYELKSDIWSLGCIIYEACALKPPFTANNMQGLYKKVMKGLYPKLPSTYSQKLQSIIARCLELNPNKRISCRELLSILPQDQRQRTNLQQNYSQINLLSTIKMPKNPKNWKLDLPKSNYETQKSNTLSSIDLTKRYEKMFGHVSHQKLRQIVKAKQLEKSILAKKSSRKGINPEDEQTARQHYQKLYTQNDAYDRKNQNMLIGKRSPDINLLPKIKLYSEIAQHQKRKPNRVQEILSRLKQNDKNSYEYNRPVWWG